MTIRLETMTDADFARVAPVADDAGLGALSTERGNLPLDTVDIHAAIVGLDAKIELTQGFRNTFDVPLEATYIFPLPDRAAVTALRMEADGHIVDGVLKERAEARATYDQAIAEGKRASIAEEERPDVFTMRVGNILPGEHVTVRLTLVGPLSYSDGEGLFRFPLVVAPRYIPGAPIGDSPVGAGWQPDTDAVPDASRISPPVLLPGFPNPVSLTITVDVDPAGFELTSAISSLHSMSTSDEAGGVTRLHLSPGERANRDLILRLRYGQGADITNAFSTYPDDTGEEHTFSLTVLPPSDLGPAQPRDVVLLLDRSGSMGGWKMVAARRAAARIIDTLTETDRFAVLSFDHVVETPDDLPAGLVEATDRNRFKAVRHLSMVDSRGGTEMLAPLQQGVALLGPSERERVLVLVTDGQVGNEDQIVSQVGKDVGKIRLHTVGIDRAVNVGFLNRLATLGGGRCELVESEDRLDQAMAHIHRRIGSPLVTRLSIAGDGVALIDGTLAPSRLPDLFPGVPLRVSGRCRNASGTVMVRGQLANGEDWSVQVAATPTSNSALRSGWAREHLRDLEDRYVVAGSAFSSSTAADLEKQIIETSLRFGVLCRFTAFVAVDSRVVTQGGKPHQVTQPVESVEGWEEAEMADFDHRAVSPVPAAFMVQMPASSPVPPPPAAPGGPGRPFPNPTAAFGAPQARAGGPPRAQRMVAKMAGAISGAVGGSVQTTAHEQLNAEASRMRSDAELPGFNRLMALADLGTRLAALVQELEARGADRALLDQLRRLASELEACDGDSPPRGDLLVALWDRTLVTLDHLASDSGGSAADSPDSPSPGLPAPSPGEKPEDQRRTFWKR